MDKITLISPFVSDTLRITIPESNREFNSVFISFNLRFIIVDKSSAETPQIVFEVFFLSVISLFSASARYIKIDAWINVAVIKYVLSSISKLRLAKD